MILTNIQRESKQTSKTGRRKYKRIEFSFEENKVKFALELPLFIFCQSKLLEIKIKTCNCKQPTITKTKFLSLSLNYFSLCVVPL